jgi:hypothetical protein
MSGGYLYLALTSPWVQIQLKAGASGSVVDALKPESVSKVVIPMLDQKGIEALGLEVERCWNLISESIALSESTVAKFEKALHGPSPLSSQRLQQRH